MTWRKIPEGQEPEWGKLFEWLISEGFLTSTDLRATQLNSLAREPQGLAKVGGQRIDLRPEPQKVVDLLERKGVLTGRDLTELRAMGERPLRSPEAIRRVLSRRSKS